MPKFSSSYLDGQCAGNILRIQRAMVNTETNEVITKCKNAIINNPIDRQFVDRLVRYLEMRKKEMLLFSCNNKQVEARMSFVAQLLPFICDDNSAEQLKLLDDKNILKFKGFFSTRLYDLLVERRTHLQGKDAENLERNKPRANP